MVLNRRPPVVRKNINLVVAEFCKSFKHTQLTNSKQLFALENSQIENDSNCNDFISVLRHAPMCEFVYEPSFSSLFVILNKSENRFKANDD